MSLPTTTKKPGVYIDQNVKNAILGLLAIDDNICVIGQRTSSGIVAANTPTVCYSDADAALNFGSGSVCHRMAKTLFEQNATTSGITICAVDDAAGSTDATGTVAVDSTHTSGGTLNIWVGDQRLKSVYTSSSSTTNVADGIITDASRISESLPVTVSWGGAATVNFVAKNKGRVGNCIPLKATDADNGAANCTVTAMTGGAGDPDVGNYSDSTGCLPSVVSGSYTIFVNGVPNNASDYDSASKIKSMVDFVSGETEQRPAIQVFGATDLNDTLANMKTVCGTNLNNGRTTGAYITYANTNGACVPYYEIAAQYAGDIASQSDPALPYNGDVLVSIPAPAVIDRLTRTQQEDMLTNGVTPLAVLSGESVAVVKAISTYTTNASGYDDETLLNINVYRILDYVRAQLISQYTNRFNKSKITTRLINTVKDVTYQTLKQIELLEIIKNVDTYKDSIEVAINSSNPNRIDIDVPCSIVSPLDIIAGTLKLRIE